MLTKSGPRSQSQLESENRARELPAPTSPRLRSCGDNLTAEATVLTQPGGQLRRLSHLYTQETWRHWSCSIQCDSVVTCLPQDLCVGGCAQAPAWSLWWAVSRVAGKQAVCPEGQGCRHRKNLLALPRDYEIGPFYFPRV